MHNVKFTKQIKNKKKCKIYNVVFNVKPLEKKKKPCFLNSV